MAFMRTKLQVHKNANNSDESPLLLFKDTIPVFPIHSLFLPLPLPSQSTFKEYDVSGEEEEEEELPVVCAAVWLRSCPLWREVVKQLLSTTTLIVNL